MGSKTPPISSWSAFFSIAEIALAASRRLKLRQLADEGDARAEALFDEAWDEDELEGLELWDEPTVPSGEPSPRPRDANALAILAFQEDHGLELTGELDAATRSKLEAEYDGVG